MLLVSKFGFVEENDVEVFIACPLSFLCPFSSPVVENNIPVSFPFLHIVGQLVGHPPARILYHPKKKISFLTFTRSSDARMFFHVLKNSLISSKFVADFVERALLLRLKIVYKIISN